MTATDTEQPHALIERRGHVLVVTMNRPQVRNALSGPMLALLRQAWDQVDSDPDIRVCVLTGAGGAFCAGADADPGQAMGKAVGALFELPVRHLPAPADQRGPVTKDIGGMLVEVGEVPGHG